MTDSKLQEAPPTQAAAAQVVDSKGVTTAAAADADTATPASAAPGKPPQADDKPTAERAASSAASEQPQDEVATDEAAASESESASLPVWAVVLLGCQHFSSAWGYRSAEFAYPLYFVVLFTDSLLPASIYGFITTGVAILFSGSVGVLIDTHATRKLRTVRVFILMQKLSVCAIYALFLLMFLDPKLNQGTKNEGRGPNPDSPRRVDVWTVFAAITTIGSVLILSNVGVSVVTERDWVTTISDGSSARLNRLNAIMRRIDLLTKLVAPLFVSLLTATTSYSTSAIIMLSISGLTCIFELIWIKTVYLKFPELAAHELKIAKERAEKSRIAAPLEAQTGYPPSRGLLPSEGVKGALRRSSHLTKSWAKGQASDWYEFVRMPIFISSASIALLYMSALSFDPAFIAYLKSETTYNDPFIAGMRSLCVVTGLMGTFLAPWLTKKIGSIRAGTWSLIALCIPLIPVIVALFLAGPSKGRPAWNGALLFLGMALSRIGLWAFDLVQLAQVQTALSTHPRRNSLMALQFSLQNLFDLGHYGLTIGWSMPKDFKYPAIVSYGGVVLGAVLYIFLYARRERGHLVHLDKLGLQRLISRKAR